MRILLFYLLAIFKTVVLFTLKTLNYHSCAAFPLSCFGYQHMDGHGGL